MKHIALAFTLLISSAAIAKTKTIVFLDNSVSNDTYIPSNKERQIKQVFDIGVADLKRWYPKCELEGKVMVGRSELLNIIRQRDAIQKTSAPSQTVLVGLIHSSEALLAAKAFNGSDYVALSSGATADNLGQANPNFFSLANGMNRFGSVMADYIEKEFKAKNVVALVPGGSFYSRQFASALQRSMGRKIHFTTVELNPAKVGNELEKLKASTSKADVVFTPGFIQEALPILSALEAIQFAKPIVGSPNWGRSRSDLEVFSKAIGLKSKQIYFPVSWIEGESTASTKIEKRFAQVSQEVLMGTALYTYDAVIVAGSYLCRFEKVSPEAFRTFLKSELSTVKAIRDYTGLEGSSAHSKISMVILNEDKKSFSIKKVYK